MANGTASDMTVNDGTHPDGIGQTAHPIHSEEGMSPLIKASGAKTNVDQLGPLQLAVVEPHEPVTDNVSNATSASQRLRPLRSRCSTVAAAAFAGGQVAVEAAAGTTWHVVVTMTRLRRAAEEQAFTVGGGRWRHRGDHRHDFPSRV